MNERRKKDAGRAKKRYVKPEVKQVQLKPEEAILGFCKTISTGGPNIGIGTTCAIPGKCHAYGS
jgi:hypothetical protein